MKSDGADCGCTAADETKRAALTRARAARGKGRKGEYPFKQQVRNLACLCRDAGGRMYPCDCGPTTVPPTDLGASA